ncbi:hypothetical protein EON65_37065 [archaeon]|nr:MAG: hypothetical protein EON65_37065 [archaeon]
MEELVALSIEVSSLKLEHRRGSVGLAKIGVGCFDDIYRKVPPTEEHFGVMSLFSFPASFTLQELFTEGVQFELYSEKSSLELVCAGRLEKVDEINMVLDNASSNRTLHHRSMMNSVLKQISAPIRLMLPLYFKTGDTFTIAAGSVEMELRVYRVIAENGMCSSLCQLDNPLSNQVVLQMPAAQTSMDLTDRSSELSEESSELIEPCDSDASLDDFVQTFLAQTSAKKKIPNPPTVLRESVQSVETVQTQLSALKHKVREREGRGDADEGSHFKFRRPKKPKVPHYMMPARTPSFQDMLRKR